MLYNKLDFGRAGGTMVSILTFNHDDPSLNPAGYLLSLLWYKRAKILEKEANVGPCKKRDLNPHHFDSRQGNTFLTGA